MDKLPINVPLEPPRLGPELLNSATFQAVAMLAIFFFAVTLMAIGRRFLIKSSMQGAMAGFVMGIIAVLGVAGGFIYLTKNYLHGENSKFLPETIKVALSGGQQNLTNVLGISAERNVPTAQSVVSDYNDLAKLDAELVRNSLCRQEDE